MKKWVLLSVLLLVVTGIAQAIPNPSAVYCTLQGYEYKIRTDEQGNQYGVCVFPDGSECGAWDYYCKCEPNGIGCWPGNFTCHWPCKKMRCKEAGESVLVSKCCEGLDEIYPSQMFDANCNKLELVGWLFLCSDCGNGICESWESKCNCPDDCARPRPIYVDDDAMGANDGSSWTNAFNNLQDALATAQYGDEIWVAQGIYKPDEHSTDPNGSGDREATFELINDVAVKGGYAGSGEPDPDGRDINAYETILSGDIGTVGDKSDNSYHVVTGSGTDANAVLDGFTVTAGNAYDRYYGGGMLNYDGSPTLTNCTFNDNSAHHGGGMYNNKASPTVTNCTFTGNSAVFFAGGMYNYISRPMLTNCTFTGNFAVDSGGAMCNYYSSPMLNNCTFTRNFAIVSGGGMWNIHESNLTLTNCTFSSNSGTNRGAAIYNGKGSSAVLSNCILWGNIAPSEAQIYNDGTSSAAVTYSDVQGSWAGTGNIDANPCFVDADGPDDILGTEDDDLRLAPGSPCIDAGDNTSVPADSADLDGDTNTTEPTPLDLDGLRRFRDDAATPDTGNGTLPIVDMGAYEYQPESYTLTVSSTSGGTVADPGEGLFEYDYDTVVQITAAADTYWHFLKWTDTAVNAGKVEDPNAANTTVRMKGDYMLRANFIRPSIILYVDTDANGANNGTNWTNAFKYLQDALAVAETDDQIWVAEGTYKPDQGGGQISGSRTATFQLINGVGIYGGFPSGGGYWSDRDSNVYETILSGDLNGDDEPHFVNNDENSYHVVTGSGTDVSAVLDGFTITAGNTYGDGGPPGYPTYKGGGMYNSYGSPRVTNCTFRDNSAIEGGGMYNTGGSPTMTSCTFSGNSATYGGGIFNICPPPTPPLPIPPPIPTKAGHFTLGADSLASIDLLDDSYNMLTLIGCTFSGNSATYGGGMYNDSASPTLTNCTFSSNSAANWGGGMSNSYSSSPTLTNCTFSGNYSVFGGAVDNYESCSLKLSNCILWDNTANNGPQLAGANTSTLSVNYCNVQGGRVAIHVDRSTTLHWGDGNIDDDPLFVDPDNPDTSQRDYHLRPGSPCIDVADNTALPPDTADLDGDANSTEPIPFDLDGHPRIIDDDCNDTEIVDMGAYEFNYVYMGDFNYQCDVDFEDFAILALAWLTEPGDEEWNRFCDISIPPDNSIDMLDLAVVVDNWLFGK